MPIKVTNYKKMTNIMGIKMQKKTNDETKTFVSQFISKYKNYDLKM